MTSYTNQRNSLLISLCLTIAGSLLQLVLPESESLDKTLLAITGSESAVLVTKSLAGALILLLPYWLILKLTPGNTEKQLVLLKAVLKATKHANGITLEQIHDLKTLFEENKYHLKLNQEREIKSLISSLDDLRITQAERKSEVTAQQRKELTAEERVLLDRIQKYIAIIEKYLRKLT